MKISGLVSLCCGGTPPPCSDRAVDVPGISFAIMWLNALQAYCPFAMGSGPNRSEEVRHYIAVGSRLYPCASIPCTTRPLVYNSAHGLENTTPISFHCVSWHP